MGAAQQVAKLVAAAGDGHVVFLTGAGISVGAGLGTYRGPKGLWTTQPDLELLLSSTIAPEDYGQLWEHTDSISQATGPSSAHRAIADIARLVKNGGGRCTVITQNIDGLHEASGVEALNMHGTATVARCSNRTCLTRHRRDDCVRDTANVAVCAVCGSRCRPDVILFGENLDEHVVDSAYHAVKECAVLIVAGTSLDVAPVNTLPAIATNEHKSVIWANPDKSPDTRWLHLKGSCDTTLVAVVEHLETYLS